MQNKTFTAANWSRHEDGFTQTFDTQNKRQFWLPEEISLTGDIFTWQSLNDSQRATYKKVLAGLTMLDSLQGDVGVPALVKHVKGHQRKAVLTFMAMMENAVHAKSYSNIFMTLATTEEIDSLFRWVEENEYLQRKAAWINQYYENISDDISLYKAMVASVYLESFLFYSGFYYPLYFGGQGVLMNSAEVISLIIRDESIHGVYVGLLAQEIYNAQPSEIQEELREWGSDLLEQLYVNEIQYTHDVYDSVGLTSEVRAFIQYNANKALANLGFEAHFEHVDVNPVVLNGLSTKSKSHDFFSAKGNSYKIAIVEPIKDEDFNF